jgi:hypothetical protein
MWVVKSQGQTFYVHHFESSIGFRTKETPDNPATKGSIQLKGNLTITDNESGEIEATIY